MATSIEGQAGQVGAEAPPPSMGTLVAIRTRTVERTRRFDAALHRYAAAVDSEVAWKSAGAADRAKRAELDAELDAARADVVDVAGEWLALAEDRERALELQPTTLEQAVDAQWQAQATYEAALASASAAARRWSALDVIGSRVRRDAVKRLAAGGMSATAADKAASDDEVYASHKDRVAQLLDEKLDAEAARDGALQRLLSARATVEALVAREQSRTAGTMREVRDWALGGKAPF